MGQNHSVMTVIEGDLPTKFEDFDLRFFSCNVLCDSYNGKGGAANGMVYTMILYGTRLVFEKGKSYEDSVGGNSWEKGDPNLYQYFKAAQLYLQVLNIGYAKYFKEDVEPAYEGQPEESRDVILGDQKILQLMLTHPQFKATAKTYGLYFEPSGGPLDGQRVHVSNFYEEKEYESV